MSRMTPTPERPRGVGRLHALYAAVGGTGLRRGGAWGAWRRRGELARFLSNSPPEPPVATYNLYEAKNNLSALVERALAGEEIVIARRNTPAVRLTPIVPKPERRPGRFKGMGRLTDAFFEPLPEEEMEGL